MRFQIWIILLLILAQSSMASPYWYRSQVYYSNLYSNFQYLYPRYTMGVFYSPFKSYYRYDPSFSQGYRFFAPRFSYFPRYYGKEKVKYYPTQLYPASNSNGSKFTNNRVHRSQPTLSHGLGSDSRSTQHRTVRSASLVARRPNALINAETTATNEKLISPKSACERVRPMKECQFNESSEFKIQVGDKQCIANLSNTIDFACTAVVASECLSSADSVSEFRSRKIGNRKVEKLEPIGNLFTEVIFSCNTRERFPIAQKERLLCFRLVANDPKIKGLFDSSMRCH